MNVNEYEGEPKRRQWIKFAPEFNSGTVGVILTIATGIFWLGGEQSKQRIEIDNLKLSAIADTARGKEALMSVSTDVKETQKSVNDVKETLAGIKAQLGVSRGK